MTDVSDLPLLAELSDRMASQQRDFQLAANEAFDRLEEIDPMSRSRAGTFWVPSCRRTPSRRSTVSQTPMQCSLQANAMAFLIA
jgi:hypothetical protein